MIEIDDRERQKHPAFLAGVPVRRLEAADVHVEGPHANAGIEIKRIPDLLAVIADGRFIADQLPRLLEIYSRCYLLTIGDYAATAQGALTVQQKDGSWERPKYGRTPHWTIAEVEHWIMDMGRAGVTVVQLLNELRAERWIRNLDSWANQDRAKTFDAIYIPPIPHVRRPSLKRQIASLLPGVGPGKSKSIEEHYASVREMVNADELTWATLPGIGKTLAAKIVKAVS